MLSPARRRAIGAFYTPPEIASRLVAIALEPLAGAVRICDPACGEGVFLLEAGRQLEGRGIPRDVVARELLWGCDLDASALSAARDAIVAWSGVDPVDHLVVADGLRIDEQWAGRFDVVVGNPPFMNQLERATVRRDAVPNSLASFTRPYTDTAWLFLLVARRLAAAGGRVVLLQPQSVLAARDAGPVRECIGADLAGLWCCDETLFDASVRVCAPVIGHANGAVRRWVGREMEEIEGAGFSVGWGTLAPSRVPPVTLPPAQGVLGDRCSATAGFRAQFYGLAPHVRDEPHGDHPLLVTCGLIDIGSIAWGERPARFAGRRYLHPRVDVDSLEAALGRWVRQQLRPKVLLATQTKVLEPAVDREGHWVPSTPVVAVHPREPADIWRCAAVLLAPAVSAWAARQFAGAALSPGSIKISAAQVLRIPLPRDRVAWQAAGEALRDGDICEAARRMDDAYGTEAYAWWGATGWARRVAGGHH